MKKSILLIIVLFVFFHGQAQSFYKTPSGKKYHLGSCRMVENVSEKISLTEAKRQNLEPCKICQPTASPQNLSSGQQEQGADKTVQCKGITRSGTRCRHMTRIANGYCFQHNPDKKE
jgi:hypothetical protein